MQSKGTVPLSSCGGGTNIPRATQPDCSCSVMLDVFCGADRGEWELSSSRGQCWPWTCCTVMVCWIMFCMVTCCLLRVQGRCPVLWAGRLVVLLGCGVTSSLVFNLRWKGMGLVGLARCALKHPMSVWSNENSLCLELCCGIFGICLTKLLTSALAVVVTRCSFFEQPSDLAHKTHSDSSSPQGVA